MADRDVDQVTILAEQTLFQLRRTGQTDFADFKDVIDDSVNFEREGGDKKSFTAISGNAVDVPTKIKFFNTTIPMWFTTEEIEIIRSMFGEPVVTGTGPFVHTFQLNNLSQQMDITVTGPTFQNAANTAVITGTDATVTFEGLEIGAEGIWKYNVGISIPASNAELAITTTTDLS